MNEVTLIFKSELVNLILVTIFSLFIGLSQRHLHGEKSTVFTFGTDRTFTFIGILGYVLFLSDPSNKILFLGGAILISVFFAIQYAYKIKIYQEAGLTTILVALLTYFQSIILLEHQLYLYLLYIVIVLVLCELKDSLISVTRKFDKHEFITFAKFLVISGIVLPLLPDKPVVEYLSITPYKIWLAVVVISTISYVSYLLRKFVFKESGLLLIGILGGLYSSTATTVVLARKSKSSPQSTHEISAGILMAIAMMYLRIAILVYIFNHNLASILAPYLFILMVFSLSSGLVIHLLAKKRGLNVNDLDVKESKHPLEFNVALVFTALYIVFTFVNYFAIKEYGTQGLNLLAMVVGVADIDPFLLNLFQGKYAISADLIASASLLAIVSNNLLKMFYAIALYPKGYKRELIIAFVLVTSVNLIMFFIL